ncbi:barstar family protein [Methanolobus sp.]|uniref:barstar family protein n=1 Tax=Methanolobus sp. TaxID=1874737 RepID=UPI0025CBD9BD|nr:barstar family protein [Methanolobus sp.]
MKLNKYIHFIACDADDLDEFIETFSTSNDDYLAEIDGNKCIEIENLYSEFQKTFQFPDYFGCNWAAFDECLNDLDWINAKSYILIVRDMDKILPEDDVSFNLLLKYLRIAVTEWTEGRNYDDFPTKETPFHLYLHSSKENKNELYNRLQPLINNS